jgi:hypothetical protein
MIPTLTTLSPPFPHSLCPLDSSVPSSKAIFLTTRASCHPLTPERRGRQSRKTALILTSRDLKLVWRQDWGVRGCDAAPARRDRTGCNAPGDTISCSIPLFHIASRLEQEVCIFSAPCAPTTRWRRAAALLSLSLCPFLEDHRPTDRRKPRMDAVLCFTL